MHLYLAYGSNLSSRRLEARVGPVPCFGAAWVPGYRHRFSKLGRDGSGKGNLEAAGGDESAFGVLYRLSTRQWSLLAPYEDGYDRAVVEVLGASSRPMRVETFLAQEIVAGLVPTSAYTAHYARGLTEHGLPAWYRAALLSGTAP